MAELAVSRHRRTPRVRYARMAEALALALTLLFALRLRAWNLDAYTGSFDEGIRSQQLLLMAAGYRPFREIFASQGPLLLDLLYPFFLLGGQTLEAARAGVVFFSVVGLVGAWWVGRLAAGPIAGLVAAALLTLSPTYLEGSRLALAEVPTIAPALLSMGAALAYRRSGERHWLVPSAALCALALLIKPMVIHLGAPLLALLLSTDRARESTPPPNRLRPAGRGLGGGVRLRGADLALYAGVVVLLCALVIGALGPAAVWDNLGAYRAGAGRELGSDWVANLRLTLNVLSRERVGLFAVAGVGLLLGLWRRPGPVVPIALWLGAILALFALYGDLADKHIVYLVPPLALLGGVGVGLASEAARTLVGERTAPGTAGVPPAPAHERAGRPRSQAGAVGWLVPALSITALGVYLWNLQPLYRADLYVIFDAERVAERRRDLPAELDMAEVMRERATPDEWVLSDNPNAAFRARRLVIPALVDTSGTRVDAGSLTDARAIEAVSQHRPAVIVTWARRLGRLADFIRWLPRNGYRLDREYDGGWKLYVRG